MTGNPEVGKSLFPDYITTDIETVFTTPPFKWFLKYQPMDNTLSYRATPGADVVESYPLSFVKPVMPDISDIKFPCNEELTTVQLDAVRLASRRFQQKFSDSGVTKGFLLGDGPGLGKTRILAAIIYNEFLKGFKRHLFLSISDILFQDVVAEFEKIASSEWVSVHVKNLHQFESTLRLQQFEGVLFMTYHRLRKQNKYHSIPSKVSKLSGLDVIAIFCANQKPFSGVIALDESHVGKNALNPVNELRSATGKMMLDLIWTYKQAKVIYSTATPASNSNHYGIMSRLGIWDSNCYLSDFPKFNKLMNKWELAASEIMALKLKQAGAMVSRQISFEGVVTRAEFIPPDSEPECFEENYDIFSAMWREMYQDILVICELCDADAKRTKIATFFSAMMNFFRAIIIDSKINHLVEIIKNEIAKDNVVVVGIQGTGEASYNAHVNTKDTEVEFLISNAKEIMEKLVRNHFRVPGMNAKQTEKANENDTYDSALDNKGQNTKNPAVIFNVLDDLSVTESEGEAEDNGLSDNTVEKETCSEPGSSQNHNISSTDNSDSPIFTIQDHSNKTNETMSENTFPENTSYAANASTSQLGQPAFAATRINRPKLDNNDFGEVHAIRKKWLDKITQIKKSPPNFLDEIQRRLAKCNNITVAEITGRKLHMTQVGTVVEKVGSELDSDDNDLDESDSQIITKYKLADRVIDCDHERKEFMEGRANVAIISDAGSTGISLHASNAKEEFCKKKRIHITVELGWSAEKVLQQLGRTHRANQKQPPEYIFLLSNVPSEIRFTSIILGRLETMSTFTCAQRHIDLCHRLEEQAQYDSNAGIRGIRAALAFFFDENVPLPYQKDVPLKHKVFTELAQLGLKNKKKSRRYGESQGRTLKRINLTKTMNKLLGCSISVQKVFCDVWLFYLTYFKEQYSKDVGVIVISPDICRVIADKRIENLVKVESQEGIVTNVTDDKESDQDDAAEEKGSSVEGEDDEETHASNQSHNGDSENDESENDDSENDNSENDDSESVKNSREHHQQGKRGAAPSHGPIQLVPLHVFLGSTVSFIKNLHDSASKSDAISGFYDDCGFHGLRNPRNFYLQNKCLTEADQNFIIQQKKLPIKHYGKTVCMLYQPHQPPIELDANQVLEFTSKMVRLQSDLALRYWLQQAAGLKDDCIHKYRFGCCPSLNCEVGRRHGLKYLVVGDLPAIWKDIIETLNDEDPSVIVCKENDTEEVRIGIEIPKLSVTDLQMRIAGYAYLRLKAKKGPPRVEMSEIIEKIKGKLN